jgi:hypothetical protein
MSQEQNNNDEQSKNLDTPGTGALEGIGARLAQQDQGGTQQANPDAPQPVTPAPFDIASLRPEQIQQLKEMFANTPERANQKKANPRVTIRRYRGDDGQSEPKIIVNFGRAYSTLVKDDHTNITEEVMRIPVRFLGEEKDTLINYRTFMNSEQVVCEVVNLDRQKQWVVEDAGRPVKNKETGELVERGYFKVNELFTIKLPEGSTPAQIVVEGHIVNG